MDFLLPFTRVQTGGNPRPEPQPATGFITLNLVALSGWGRQQSRLAEDVSVA